MPPLATIGALLEVTPWDEPQFWPDANTPWSFIDDRTPFRFRVAGELREGDLFIGLFGPIESGPERYVNLLCNVLLRGDSRDWRLAAESSAAFKAAPTIAKRVPDYDPAMHCDIPFYQHPDGTFVEGYPQVGRFGGICVIDEPDRSLKTDSFPEKP